MERSIGAAKGKHRRVHSDPYAGGERSGKRAKPDAISAVANANARVHACAPPASMAAPPRMAAPAMYMPASQSFT